MRRVVAGDRSLEAQLNSLVQEIAGKLELLQASPFGQGQLIPAISLPIAATVSVTHNLGRPFRGWWATRIYRGTMTTWLLSEGNSQRPAEAISLVNGCDAAIKIDLFVF